MNRLFSFLFLFCLLSTTLVKAQSEADVSKSVSDMADNNNSQNNNVVYKLFPTHNIWTFIKLDTRNGKMTQVQYGLKQNDRFENILSDISLLVNEEKEVNGRFILYQTTNTFNFILLDQFDGRVWQVQWSDKPEQRFVIPI